MNVTRWMLRILLAFGLVGLSGSFVTQAPAVAASPGPSVTITPHADINDPWGDGQYVTVTWKNFAPNYPVAVKECQHGATSLSQCSRGNLYSTCGFLCPGDWLLGISDKNGNGSGVVPVATGKVNTQQDGSDVPGYTFKCGPADSCDLWVTNDTLDMSQGIFVPIGFQVPPGACAGSGTSLSGSGTASGFMQFLNLAIDACSPPDNIDLSLVLQTSAKSLDDYIGGFSPFAVSSVAMTNGQKQQMNAAGRTAGYAPVLASGEVFAFRIYDTKTQNQVTHLTLTPELLAKIFSGQLKYWNIPAIKALNPSVHFPSTIAAIGRGEATEETYQVTKWFWENAQDAWKAAGKGVKPSLNPFTGPTDTLPSLASSPNPVALVSWANIMANTVRTGGADYGSLTQYGTIGYMDSSVAARYGLATVTIKFPNGKRVAATPKTIQNGIGGMHKDIYGVFHPNWTLQSKSAYPLPVVSYMVIPRGAKKSDSPPSQEVGDALTKVVKLAVGAGQDNLARGYAPLPQALVQEANTVAGQVWSAPPLPTPNHDGNNGPGGDDSTGPNSQGTVPGGSGTIPGTTTTIPTTDAGPTTTTEQTQDPSVTGTLPVLPPAPLLVATTWSKAMPFALAVGLGCLVIGAVLLLGGDVRGSLKRSGQRVKSVVPIHRKPKTALHSVDGSSKPDEAAA
jgi:ABC-type phosphate transport system substrate-binding protein